MFCKISFKSLCKFTPREHDAPPAARALEPNVRAQPCDGPLIGTARMLFSEAETIVETKIG